MDVKIPLLKIEKLIQLDKKIIAIDRLSGDLLLFQIPKYRLKIDHGQVDVYEIGELLIIQGLWGYGRDVYRIPTLKQEELQVLDNKAWGLRRDPKVLWADKEIKTNELLDKYIEEVLIALEDN